MDNELMFSSKYDAWATPQAFFDKLNAEFNFDIDVCAADDTAKCESYWTKEDDALSKDWFGWGIEHLDAHPVCFMNPPYSRSIGKFVKKAYDESKKGSTVVALLPARTCTKWFHKYIWNKDKNQPKQDVEVRFTEGRLIFGTDEYWQWVWEQKYLPGKDKPNSLYKKYGKKNSAPFPSMLVVFNK